MSFTTQLANLQFQGNIVLEIDGTNFSQYAVDSGLTVPAANIGIVMNATINPISVDIRKVKTSVNSLTFELLDHDEVITAFLDGNANSLMGVTVKFYFGFITGSYDWADYKLLAETQIKTLTKTNNTYKFTSSEPTSQLKTPIHNTFSTLNGAITAGATSLILDDASSFPSSGQLEVGGEFITWASKTSNTLNSLTRGNLTGVGAAHDDGDQCNLVTTRTDNSMDMLLDIMQTDAGVASGLIDTAAFTTLRDNDFATDGDFTAVLYDIPDALDYIEQEILLATNTRLFTKDGKISIALLDQAPISGVGLSEINEDHARTVPTFRLNDNKIVNKVIIRWNFIHGTGKFSRIATTENADSIATFGERKPLELEFKNVTAAGGGAAIVADRAARLLSRFRKPQGEITIDTHINRQEVDIGDNVLFTNNFIPSGGGALGFSEVLEVLSKAPTGFGNNARIKWKLAFTSYTGLRLGAISPSPLISSISSQTVFDVAIDAASFKTGYKVRLWNSLTNVYESDPVNTISSVAGSTITVDTAWTTTLTTDHMIFFADYTDCSSLQRARYSFVSPNSNIFADGENAYQIIL